MTVTHVKERQRLISAHTFTRRAESVHESTHESERNSLRSARRMNRISFESADGGVVTTEGVRSYFSKFGAILDAYVGHHGTVGSVQFDGAEAYQSAAAASQHIIDGSTITLVRLPPLYIENEDEGVRIYIVCSKFVKCIHYFFLIFSFPN